MTVWWGLAGLLGLLGLCGLFRSHRADGAAVSADPLERYPAAREPVTPNADAAHTPLMTPAITPEVPARPALPREEAAVPESGRIAGEIPAPRPVGDRPVAPAEVPAGDRVSVGAREGVQAAGSPVPQQPKHALRAEATGDRVPETAGVRQARAETGPEPRTPAKETSPPPERKPAGIAGKLRRLLGRR